MAEVCGLVRSLRAQGLAGHHPDRKVYVRDSCFAEEYSQRVKGDAVVKPVPPSVYRGINSSEMTCAPGANLR